MAWVNVGSLAQLPRGAVHEATFGDRRFAVCNVDGVVHVLAGSCPHRGGPLGQGTLDGGKLECPWHAWQFDCRTGAIGHSPGLRIGTFEVMIEDGDILINLS